ncbi:MAG: CBU_0592 family membrane protein [Hyphomicrobium sp.]
MDAMMSLSGIVGALCCVGMYAAVSFGKISAERPIFYIVNGLGASLVLVGASHRFDVGDIGTIGQELIWAAISLIGAVRAWTRDGDTDKQPEQAAAST